jgi:muconate cycloisomerase
MRWTHIVARQVRIPLRRAIQHASHRRTSTDNLIVEIRLEDGSSGFGEGVPRDYVTGETIDTALATLRRTDWSNALPQEPTKDFAAAVAAAEALALPSAADDPRGIKTNATRCAVELAWLDAWGRHFRQPLSSVVALVAAELYKPRRWVQYSTAITSAKGTKAWLLGWLMRLYGFAQCKVKVGITGQDDVARLATLRRAMGQRMELRLDANEAWHPDELLDRVRPLLRFGIASLEQPVPHEEIGALAGLRGQLGVPLMHDESLCGMTDAQAAVRDGTCDRFNLRLSKCGGFLPTLRLAQFARQHGIACQLGCQVGETALLSAAGRHFACAVDGLVACEGSYDSRLVREALGTTDLTFGYGGWAPALTGGGLGIEVDRTALERVTVRQEVLHGA